MSHFQTNKTNLAYRITKIADLPIKFLADDGRKFINLYLNTELDNIMLVKTSLISIIFVVLGDVDLFQIYRDILN